jgi:hypothetical protein
LTVQAGRLLVVIEGVELMVIVYAWLAMLFAFSVAVIVKSKVPVTVGFPVMAPVLVVSERPFGRLPEEREKVTGDPAFSMVMV